MSVGYQNAGGEKPVQAQSLGAACLNFRFVQIPDSKRSRISGATFQSFSELEILFSGLRKTSKFFQN